MPDTMKLILADMQYSGINDTLKALTRVLNIIEIQKLSGPETVKVLRKWVAEVRELSVKIRESAAA